MTKHCALPVMLLLAFLAITATADAFLLSTGAPLGLFAGLSLLPCILYCVFVVRYTPTMHKCSHSAMAAGVLLYALLFVMPLVFGELVLMRVFYEARPGQIEPSAPMDPMAIVDLGILISVPFAIGSMWYLAVETARAVNVCKEARP